MPEATAVQASVDVPIYLEGYERHADARRAISSDALETINVEPLFAIQATQKAMPRLKALRPRLIQVFTTFNPADLDNLLEYGYGFAHATTLLRTAEPQASGFDALVAECSETLGKLDAYLRAAIEGGVVSTTRLSELKGGSSHRNVVHDLLLVAQIYRANWAKIEGKTFFTLADIRHADALAARFNAALAERESKPSGFEELNLDRQKAFTLFYRAYMRVRNAVEFLLKEDGRLDELEDVMPSLHNNRTGRRRMGEPDTETAPPTTAPGGSGVVPLVSTGGKVGMPDSDPFTS